MNFNEQALLAAVRTAAMRGVVRGTESVRNEAISLVTSPPKTGRIYRRRGIEHQASAPGEAPASDIGNLVNRITTDYKPAELTGIVTARTDYAAFLEYGTQKMEPRPFLRPALVNKRKTIEQDIQREVDRAISEFGVR